MKGIFALVVAVTLFSDVHVKADDEKSLKLLIRLLEAVQKVGTYQNMGYTLLYDSQIQEKNSYMMLE